jgi:hypothetical protein
MKSGNGVIIEELKNIIIKDINDYLDSYNEINKIKKDPHIEPDPLGIGPYSLAYGWPPGCRMK